MLDALAKVLANPATAPLLQAAARRILLGGDDYTRLHWGQPSAEAVAELADEPDRLVMLGGLHAVEYYTEKGDDGPSRYRHVFGDEKKPGEWHGPRPWLVVGLYNDRRPEELFIVRARSPYRVTTHGIEG